MESHPRASDVQDSGLNALALMIKAEAFGEGEEVRKQAVTVGAVKAIVAAMLRHPGHASIQHGGTSALQWLVTLASAQPVIAACGGPRVVAAAMTSHPSDAGLQDRGQGFSVLFSLTGALISKFGLAHGTRIMAEEWAEMRASGDPRLAVFLRPVSVATLPTTLARSTETSQGGGSAAAVLGSPETAAAMATAAAFDGDHHDHNDEHVDVEQYDDDGGDGGDDADSTGSAAAASTLWMPTRLFLRAAADMCAARFVDVEVEWIPRDRNEMVHWYFDE